MLNVDAITSQQIAVGLVENECCRLLRQLASTVPADEAVVELGAYRGRTTGWLALGSAEGHGAWVHSVDPWEDGDDLPVEYLATAKSIARYRAVATRAAYEAHLVATGAAAFVVVHKARAVDAAADWTAGLVGLLWHDALHRREDVRADLTAWLPHLSAACTIVLHDVGEVRFGVEAGARDVLAGRAGWDWSGREIHLWAKQPTKRGFMVVRRAA